MNRLHEGWDYRLRRIWAFGGFFLVVAFIMISVLVFDVMVLPGSQTFLVAIGPVLIYLASILLYWWWVFLFKGSRELEELRQVPGQGVPGIRSLKSWNTLHQAMAIHGGNVEEFIKNDKRARRPILLWYGIMNLLAVWILCPIVLGSLEILQLEPEIWFAGIAVGIALMLVATPFLASLGAKRAGKAYLAPLGLASTRTPKLKADPIALMGGGQKLIPDGPAVFEGERYGRLIHIETIGKHSLTVLQAKTPEFEVQSSDGKLVPDKGAPEGAARVQKSLRKAKRWRGIVVHAGPEGIGIQRQSRGTNMWLYDLWLGEYLFHEINAG